jgi:hypothetical protein
MTPTLEQVAAELRRCHDDNQDSSAAHLLYELRALYRWLTGQDPWAER